MDTTAPKTDDQLAQHVRRALEGAGYSQLTRIRCTAQGSRVILTGELPTYYHSQLAQTVAAKISGVRRVDNQIQVVSSSAPAFAQ